MECAQEEGFSSCSIHDFGLLVLCLFAPSLVISLEYFRFEILSFSPQIMKSFSSSSGRKYSAGFRLVPQYTPREPMLTEFTCCATLKPFWLSDFLPRYRGGYGVESAAATATISFCLSFPLSDVCPGYGMQPVYLARYDRSRS